MNKEITLSIERQQRALKAMHAAKSPVFKYFWFDVFGKILSKSIIANEDGVPYDNQTRNQILEKTEGDHSEGTLDQDRVFQFAWDTRFTWSFSW